MDRIHYAYNFLRHRLFAKDEHSVHSPFVFNFYLDSIRAREKYYVFDAIEAVREELLQSDERLEITDFGAGAVDTSKHRKVSSIAQYSLKPKEQAEMLFRILRELKAKNILDLGTSLGITTAYLASSSKDAIVHTFEGCPNTANFAQSTFSKLEIEDINIHQGNIEHTLPKALKDLPPQDVIFFDANHQKESTLRYFEWCLEKAHNESVFIFDDIYWSKGMTKAWQAICKHPKVTVSIDLFDFGLVFFRKEQGKQHFTLTTQPEKHPWMI